jgi:hypothetical protein
MEWDLSFLSRHWLGAAGGGVGSLRKPLGEEIMGPTYNI